MTDEPASTSEIAGHVVDIAEEFEASGEALVEDAEVAAARAALHAWVDTVVATVVMPGFARVATIHENGRRSTISSWDLCVAMSVKRNVAKVP